MFDARTSEVPKDYRRSLDFSTGISEVAYQHEGKTHLREVFCSYPHRVLALRIVHGGTMEVSFSPTQEGAGITAEGKTLTLQGTLRDNGMAYEARLLVAACDGEILPRETGSLVICGAGETVLLMACGTDYANAYPHYKGPHPHDEVAARLAAAEGLSWNELREAHMADHSALYNEAEIDIGGGEEKELPTDKRLEAYRQAPSRSLEETLFHYGRYLLIASSRRGSLPANLQGVWNNSNNPPWCGDYHFNINLQMNYWPAEVTGLTACSDPLAEYIASLIPPGRETARHHFGATRGYAVNTMNNPFGFTAPGWVFEWGWGPGSNAFIAMNLWDKYLFSGSGEHLAMVYPSIKEAALFWLDYLTEDEDGTLVSAPSFSPEHGQCDIGCAMDQQLAAFVLEAALQGSRLTEDDPAFSRELEEAISRLSPPLQVGKWGQLMEWKEDLDDPTDTHRHISQLVALYPGTAIHRGTPEWMDAARVTLDARGDASTGWSRAWKLCLWARLQDGDRAYRLLSGQIGGCTYPNLFDTHPPFQIDGNFGYTAGVCELLLQSHGGHIALLPALPGAWPKGSFRGLRARGGFRVDGAWNEGRLTEATLYAAHGGLCKVRVAAIGSGRISITDEAGEKVPLTWQSDDIFLFPAESGATYHLLCR